MPPETFRTSIILGNGTAALDLVPQVFRQCVRLGVADTLLSLGFIEMNRSTYTKRAGMGGDGVLDVSPDPKQIANAIGNAGSLVIAEANRPLWRPLVHQMVERIVQAHLEAGLVDSQVCWIQGFHTGHALSARETLVELKRRIPKLRVVAVAILPDDFNKRESIRDGEPYLFQLADEGIVDVVPLVDNLSPLAKCTTLAVQDKYLTTALASALGAQAMFRKNPSWAEIGLALRDYGLYAGMAFASQSVPTAKQVNAWSLGRRLFAWPERGFGEIESFVNAAMLATQDALTKPEQRAIDETINFQLPFYLIFTVPLRINDRRWMILANRLRTWLANEYPTATPVFAAGGGTPDHRLASPYWLQVSVIFPLPDIPKPIAEIMDHPNLKRVPNAQTAAPVANSLGGRPVETQTRATTKRSRTDA